MCSSQLEITDIIELYQTAKSHGYITSIGKNSHYDALTGMYFRAVAQSSEQHLMVSSSEFASFLYCSKIINRRRTDKC